MTWLVSFVAAFALDAVWALYIRYTAERRALSAAFFSVVVILLSACLTILYIHDLILLIPITAGAALGTYVTCRVNFR